MTPTANQSVANLVVEHLLLALLEVRVLSDPEESERFAAYLGVASNVIDADVIKTAVDKSYTLLGKLNSFDFNTASGADYWDAIACAKAVVDSLDKVVPSLGALWYVLHGYIQRSIPLVDAVAILLGVFHGPVPCLYGAAQDIDEKREGSGTISPQGVFPRAFYPTRVARLLRDPVGWAGEVYGWGQKFDVMELLARVGYLARTLGCGAPLFAISESMQTWLGVDDSQALEMRIALLRIGATGFEEAGFALSPLKATAVGEDAKGDGLLITPYVTGAEEDGTTLYSGAAFDVRLVASAIFPGGISFILEPGRQPTVVTCPGATLDDIQFESLGLEVIQREPVERVWVGASGGLRLGVRQAAITVGLRGDPREGDLFVEVRLAPLFVGLDASQTDGFVGRILPMSVESEVELLVGWSVGKKFYFGGSAVLEASIPIHRQLGPISIDEVQLCIGLGTDDALSMTVTTSFGFELGPVAGSIERIGLSGGVAFNDVGGPPTFRGLQFCPPVGAALSVDAGGIVGAGILARDESDGSYFAGLGLTFGQIGLTAFGLITTKMPDGSKGFALLIDIGVTFSPPIQLSFGFALCGVGGLIAINRTMDVDALRVGVRNRTLDSILFPDPATIVPNASKIVSDLRSVFPPQDGRYIVGPMVRITWGNKIIAADIGIFLELPAPLRVVLMGQVEAMFPNPQEPVVVLHLDLLGVLDVEKQELTFQASLYDSRILTYTLVGDSAFLLAWGDDPRFALSVGGFHPKFTPPAPAAVFADMRRLSLSISSGSALQLSCQAYQALTPNSLQFGARVDLYASEGGATLTGYLGFDTLIYFSPFAFEAWMGAGVQVTYEGASFLDVELSLMLSGPTPWVARGKAKIRIFFVSVKVGFCVQWGEEGHVATLPLIDPLQEVHAALSGPAAWSSALPAGRTAVEFLKGRQETTDQILVHPGGRLEVRQRVIPLGLTLAKVGNAPIAGHDYFDIEAVKIDEAELTLQAVEEFFARGQFEDLTADQKLSVPSFEKMKGGVAASSDEILMPSDFECDIFEYESVLIRPDRTALKPKPGRLAWKEAKDAAGTAAQRRTRERTGSRERFASTRLRTKVKVTEEKYCLATGDTLSRLKANGSEQDRMDRNRNLTRVQADQLLREHFERCPEGPRDRLVVAESEVAA